jgi:hypothetical protein
MTLDPTASDRSAKPPTSKVRTDPSKAVAGSNPESVATKKVNSRVSLD